MTQPDSAENPGTEPAGLSPDAPAQTEATQGYEYIVQKGDSLAGIANGFTDAGVSVSPTDILEANPGLDPARLRVGQRVFVPAKKQ